MTAQPLVLNLKDIDKKDLPIVGGKGANLGEMIKSGFPVPGGFCVTVQAYDLFLSENSLNQFIFDLLESLDTKDPEQLNSASRKIQAKIKNSKISDNTVKAIFKEYKSLSGVLSNALVAVRSSATAEDSPDASFAGQQATFLNVKGESNLIKSVIECWASLYTPRSIFYRVENKVNHKRVKMSVVVQKMIQSEVSGVMFSIDPVTNNKDKILIEAVWGLGEYIVQGAVLPDRYVVQKDTFSILSKEISEQDKMLTKRNQKNIEIEVRKNLRDIQKINDKEIIFLAKIAHKLQEHYYFPQDIEWAKDAKGLYIVQTRPITTIDKYKKAKSVSGDVQFNETPILTGISASPGVASGVVKIVKDSRQISKIHQGDVLVSEMTSPDFVPAMKKAAAIITDKGGQTSHAAIVSRELGVPCIVGTENATKILKDNQVITVDAVKGLIYMGGKVKIEKQKDVIENIKVKTATKLYVNLGEPSLASKIANLNVDGVGLLRAEFMIANIGIHPKEAIKLKKQDEFIIKLYQGLATFCRNFSPRPVVYRATDFKTNEYRSLKGGANWEPLEPNPMLGYRGAFRYLNDPEVFSLELKTIKKVMEKYNNLWLMVPFVRSPEELYKIKRMITAEGLYTNPNFKLWMMVEIPANVISLEDFIDVGIDGVSIGSNDLTMLLTGTDRDNQSVAQTFNERSKTVMWAIRRTIRICQKRNITSSICGQAPSTYDDFAEKLISMGITSISVNPDSINRVRKLIYEAEKNINVKN